MSETLEYPEHVYWKLIVDDGTETGQPYPMTNDTLTIGSDLINDIPLDDEEVADQHVRLIREGDKLFIQDLNSRSGTFVNKKSIFPQKRYSLEPNDIFKVGPYTFRVEKPFSETSQTDSKMQKLSSLVPHWSKLRWGVLVVGGGIVVLIFVVMGRLAGDFLFIDKGQTVADKSGGNSVTPTALGIEIKQAPKTNSPIQIGEMVTIQAVASDPSGITHIELRVNGLWANDLTSKSTEYQTSMEVKFVWSPDKPGKHTLEIRAYNQTGLEKSYTVATVDVVDVQDTPTPETTKTPSPTLPPIEETEESKEDEGNNIPDNQTTLEPENPITSTQEVKPNPTTPVPSPSPTETPLPSIALLTIVNSAGLNVREGPGTQYGEIGWLEQGKEVEITGKNGTEGNLWWQVLFDLESNKLGWVSGKIDYSIAKDANNVPTVFLAQKGRALLIILNHNSIEIPVMLSGGPFGTGENIPVQASIIYQRELEKGEYTYDVTFPGKGGKNGRFSIESDKVTALHIWDGDVIIEENLNEFVPDQ